MEAKVYGEKGEVTIMPAWHESEALHWKIEDVLPKEDYPKQGKGYVHEIEEVHHCLGNGLLESKQWPLSDSIALIELMDEIRHQTGVVFLEDKLRA